MSKLSILGAQRVKALTEILQDQRREAIADVKKRFPSEGEAKALVEADLGVDVLKRKLDDIIENANKMADRINAATGSMIEVKTCHSYSRGNATYKVQFDALVAERMKPLNDAIARINREFDHKERRLWLCETLDEAKSIVGIGEA